jgi:hypothetical protein
LKKRGQGQVFAATTLSENVEKDLLKRFRKQRDEGCAELISLCESLLAELANETRKKNFSFAELEENEEQLRKLESG